MVDNAWRVVSNGVTVTRTATPAMQLLRLRGFDDAVLTAIHQCLSIELPRRPDAAAGSDPRAIGLAPGEWMIVGGMVLTDALLTASAGARVAHVADLGEGRIRYAVAGPRARDLIAKGCPIDLHPRVFGTGRAVQSVLGQVLVLIDQPSDQPLYYIYADASYEHHLDLWFGDAVLEFDHQDADYCTPPKF